MNDNILSWAYMATIALSSYELTLGEYLSSYGETDFTNAGEVMKKAGSTHESVAKNRSVN